MYRVYKYSSSLLLCTQLYRVQFFVDATDPVCKICILYNINHNNHIGSVPACHWFLGLVACCYCTHKTYSSISGKGGQDTFYKCIHKEQSLNGGDLIELILLSLSFFLCTVSVNFVHHKRYFFHDNIFTL